MQPSAREDHLRPNSVTVKVSARVGISVRVNENVPANVNVILKAKTCRSVCALRGNKLCDAPPDDPRNRNHRGCLTVGVTRAVARDLNPWP